MEHKFKVGDRIKCIMPDGGFLRKGTVYTVSGSSRFKQPRATVLIEENPRNTLGYFESRFELVKAANTIENASDQELADDYRKLVSQRVPIVTELQRRGYALYVKGREVTMCITPEDISFKQIIVL